MSEMMLNERVGGIAPSLTLGVTARAKAMKAAGRNVFSFAAGEPDFDTPAHIKQAAEDALRRGETKYAPVSGLPALREAIARKLREENGVACEPAQVLVSLGAKHSLYNAIAALCREGDEVVLPAPYWLSYPEMVRVAGGVTVEVPCTAEAGFKMTPEQFRAAITPRTKAVILNSPSNPIGIVYTRGELEALVEVAVERGIYIIADEIYEKLVYENAEHASPASFSDAARALTITVNGFSKAYSMTGWRLGYLAGPRALVDAATSLQSHSTSGAVTFAQYGAIAALTGSQDCVQTMRQAFDERRQHLYERLCAIPGVACVKPSGAFYMLPDISAFNMDSVSFAERLLESQGVAVVPGAPFGAEGFVRLSYACGMKTIDGGMDGLEAFVKSL